VTGFVAVLLVGVTVISVLKLIWLVALNAVATVVIFFALDYARLQLGWES
jgi:hypothetical protein